MEKSKVSRAASRLEAAGYVAKRINPGDRRLVSLSLTEEGHALMQRLIPLALDYQTQLLKRLDMQGAPLATALQAILEKGKA